MMKILTQTRRVAPLVGLRHATITMLATFLCCSASLLAQSRAPTKPEPPKTWIDATTGHRITRLSDDPHTQTPYFNMRAFTPDGHDLMYLSSAGIHMVNLTSFQSNLLHAGHVKEALMGTRTRRIFFRKEGDGHVYVVEIDSGRVQQLATMPLHTVIGSLNSDETKIVGIYVPGVYPDFADFKIKALDEDLAAIQNSADENARLGPQVKMLVLTPAHANAVAMQRRLDSKTPDYLFVYNITSGTLTDIVKGTDWLAHPLFSPTDPNLIMYSHEGPFDKVDRIWTVRADGSANHIIHLKTTPGESVSHEFWAPDGQSIWYDLQLPAYKNYNLGRYTLATKEDKIFHLAKWQSAIHYNLAQDGTTLCADGIGTPRPALGQKPKSSSRQWIEVLRPSSTELPEAVAQHAQMAGKDDQLAPASLTYSGYYTQDRIVDLSKHDYEKMEPNPRFSPDGRLVIFNSNMFGHTYVFAVEVAKERN